ncbi:MAG: DEAD/DEAH box helicase [Planctomycetes bacterium]|nr:DEAD/DEAH box helicase [Planctomycetota bacterium]MBI3847103.1 DEAD/DEAH box helicase [Planctomycetota bacterium]
MFDSDRPCLVQGDGSVLLDAHSTRYEEARDVLARFAELVTAPEHVHTYRLSPISLWNAAALGLTADSVRADLERVSARALPQNVATEIETHLSRYGKLTLESSDGPWLRLVCHDLALREEIKRFPRTSKILAGVDPDGALLVDPLHRGDLKWGLAQLGWPVEDRAGFRRGEALAVRLRGDGFGLRDYQRAAADVFHRAGGPDGGHGVIVLPCGAGKTVVGLAVMERVCASTLVLATNIVAVRQWKREILDKTDLPSDAVGEYTGERKEIRPVTIATYQILTSRRSAIDEFPHFRLFSARDWGLVIYDEVHLLPAPVFRITAGIQATRRLGLTATLIREDGHEGDVFSLIGPKRYDVPWKTLEKSRWIAEARCHEIRVPLDAEARSAHGAAGKREQYRIASENSAKLDVVRRLVEAHAGSPTLVIGQYLDQVHRVAREIRAPLVTGATPNAEREEIFDRFRAGSIPVLVVSRVANFAIDLPCARVAIQISGSYGSRQEEAQRLGRILRPKEGTSIFYTVVSRNTDEQEFATNRQRFLTEQGYRYVVEDWSE